MNLNEKIALEITLNEEEVVNCVEIAAIVCNSEYKNYNKEPAVYIDPQLSEKFHKLYMILNGENVDSIVRRNYDKIDVIVK